MAGRSGQWCDGVPASRGGVEEEEEDPLSAGATALLQREARTLHSLRGAVRRVAHHIRDLERTEKAEAEERRRQRLESTPGPLTRESRLRRGYARREEQLWRRLSAVTDKRRVHLGLAHLQALTRERLRRWECSRQSRAHRELMRLRVTARRLQLDVGALPATALPRLRQHLHTLKTLRHAQLQRRVLVLQQLLSEELYRKRQRRPRPPWKPKPRPQKPVEEAPVEPEKIEVLPTIEEAKEEVPEVQEEVPQVEEEPEPVQKKGKKDKKEKKEKKEKEPKGKKKKAEPPPPPLPPVFRRRVEAGEEWASALAGPLGWLPPLGDDEAAIRRPPTPLAPADEFFHWRPDAVVFQEFGPGERQVRRCSLHNTSYLPARVVLLEPELDDDLWLRRLVIRPRPSPARQLLVLPGQALHVTVTLNAPGLEEWPAGALPSVCGSMRALVACRAWAGCASDCRRGRPRLLELPFRCVPVLPPPPPPAPAEPSADFTVIDFGAVPGWTETGRVPCYTRHLTLRNTGGRPCMASIHYIKEEPTPVESPEEACEEEEVEEEEVVVKPKKGGKKQKKPPKAKPQPKVVEPVEPPKSEAELLREEAEAVIAWLLGEAAAEAVHEFQWRAGCRWTCLPPGALLRLPLTFRPPEPGRYHRRYSIRFYSIPEEEAEEEEEEEEEGKKVEAEEEEEKEKEELLLEVELEAVGESVRLPVWVEPAGGVQLGAGWCAPVRCAGPLQQVLRVRAPPALGPLSLHLSPGPPALQRRELLQLLPRHDAVLRPEEGRSEFLLRLWPRPCLVEEAWRCGLWEDGALRGLQVEARVLTRFPGDPPPPLAPPLPLPVLPIALTWPRGRLQLRLDSKPPPLPEAASTLETLQLQLLLINTSEAIPLRFAVLGVPPGALVFPSRGWVLRGERLPLQLLLSPRAGLHVPLGRTATWPLRLRAVCIEQLADELDLRLQQSNREVVKPRIKRRWTPGPCKERPHKPGSWKDELEEQPTAEQLDESGSSSGYIMRGQPSAEHQDKSGDSKDDLEEEQSAEQLDESGSWKKPDEPPTAEQLGLLDESGTDAGGPWLCVEVPVVDPRCELSACRLLLPAVVLGGTALARVCLRGGNAASRSTAVVHCLPPKVAAAASAAWRSATFTVHCDRADLTVSPTRGTLLPGQEVVLYVAFRPRLRRRDVEREKAAIQERRLQELLEQQMREKAEKGKKKGGGKKGSEKGGSQKGDTPKSSRRGKEPEVPAVTSAEDLLEAEARLLRAFQPRTLPRLLTCRVHTEDARTRQTRVERLRLELWCPVSRPAFQLLGPPELDFGPTAAGTCRRLPLRLRSLDAAEVQAEPGAGGDADTVGGGDAGGTQVGSPIAAAVGSEGGPAVSGGITGGKGSEGGPAVGGGATGTSGAEPGGGDAGGGVGDTGLSEGGASTAVGGATVGGVSDAEGDGGGIGLYFSPPSPDSPFWLPHCVLEQVELPAGKEVSVPVCYRPAPEVGDDAQAEPENECDCVSVREADGDTALRVRLRGRRVIPRLTLTPKGVAVWRSEAAAGATVDCAKIDVRNDCEAELRLGVVVEAVLVAPDVPPPQPSEASAPPSPSTKGSKKSKGKPQAKKVQKQSAELTEEEQAELEGAYQPVPEEQRDLLFGTVPVPTEFELKPGGKASLKVQFSAPAPPPGPETEEPAKKDKEKGKGKEKGKDKEKGKEKGKGKQRDKSAEGTVATQDTQPTNATAAATEQPAEPRMKYAARLAVMVGGVVRMQELWFLCTTKEASAKDKKKKKKK